MTAAKNIPGIVSIEYATRSSIGLSLLLAKHISIDPFELVEGNFNSLEFVPGSAGLTEKLKEEGAGDYYEIELPFRIAGISPETAILMDTLRASDLIYRAIDPEGQGYILANPPGKVRFEYQLNNSPDPSGQRGYQCRIFLKSPSGLIFCE